jgi:recombinational DNA repair protein (RecF pathway)
MMRACTCCRKTFVPRELLREETKGMEAERKALGLEGVAFRYYACSACGHADIFVDVHPLDGEAEEAFRARRDELEHSVRQLHGEGVEVVVTERV